MENVNHIHEVLEIIHSTDKSFTKESLVSEIENVFGSEARFTTCGDHLFGIEGVIPFLLERNKINLQEGRVIPLSPPCDH